MPTPPSTGEVTSPYGPRTLNVPGVGPFHYGADRGGQGNVSPEAGVIAFALYSGVFGNIIGVRAGDVVWNIAHHAHLNGRRPGQRVAEGEYLAPLGLTGLVTGPHSHTERRVGGRDAIQSGTHTDPERHYTAPAPAGGGATPLNPQPKEYDEMASKQEIKDAVAEVVGGVKTNEHFLISYASNTHRNGIVLAGFGYWHPLSFEKFDHFSWPGSRSAQGRGLFSGLEVFTPINDRAWDILREICLQDGDAEYVPISYDKIAELVTKVDVNEASLVSQITPVVAEAVKGSVGTLTDATIKVLVKALLDEQSKRLAS
ncbi:M23 family metallopeptidase [Microbacterium sp. 2P01SA-2]|uniref:M23 family metallopeptidase n=1 Tax=unclassified Microbacterium TaxID=2609290 RepID=UPI0039A3672E